MEESLRHFNHTLKEEEVDTASVYKILADCIAEKLPTLEQVQPASSTTAKTSEGKEMSDYSIYIGTGGATYMYWRLYLNAKHKENDEKAKEYLTKGLEVYQTSLQEW